MNGASRVDASALRAKPLNRMLVGNVVDHERVQGVRERPFDIAAACGVIDGLIRTVWFFSCDQPRLRQGAAQYPTV